MALPGRDKTFAFENCRDMLLKLEREIDRYREALSVDNIETLRDTAFNACVTAWHLGDWVFNDLTAEQWISLRISSLGELQKFARECRPLYLCRQVATASKHCEFTRYPDPDVGVVVTADSFPLSAGDQGVDLLLIRWNVYFVDGESRLPAETVFEQALGFWTEFIYQNRVAMNS